MESELKENPENSGNLQGERDGLGRFKSGISGNPAGKPKGVRNFTTKVREALETVAEGKSYTYEEAFIKAILKKSIVDQDVGMMRTVWEQLDGKPLQRMGNADGSNIDVGIIAYPVKAKQDEIPLETTKQTGDSITD